LATIFLLNVLAVVAIVMGLVFRPAVWRRNRKKALKAYAAWLLLYAMFIGLSTGPTDVERYPPGPSSPYHLPWKAGDRHFVAQGNRSFVSHRGFHEYAWDFVMPEGTEVLASREGRVVEVEVSFDGIGLKSNVLVIEHEDGQRSAYAHIQHGGALVNVGDFVKRGQPIAMSGMVGQTVFPHLHFYVINQAGNSSIPISFAEVPDGVPLAGRSYTSENSAPID